MRVAARQALARILGVTEAGVDRIASEGTFAQVRQADPEFARLVELGELA